MKTQTHTGLSGTHLELIAASEAASRSIPPLWPLSSSVAVNPFLGQSGQTLASTGAQLGRAAGLRITMPKGWYAARIEDGTIGDADLTAALAGTDQSVAALKAAVQTADITCAALPTIAELAQQLSGIDWPTLIEERVGAWASGYFDTGQALWQVTPGRTAFDSWKLFASRDLTPEIAGLHGFAARVAALPNQSRPALALASDHLGLTPAAAPSYFHQLLLQMGGWSQLARYRLWQAELAGETDATTTDMLTIRLIWEQALLDQYSPQIAQVWASPRATHATAAVPSADDQALAALQVAAERAAQRGLAATLATEPQTQAAGRPVLQAAFCIDVRSEVFRRALESLDPAIQTLGFAGFFGITPLHRGFASDVDEARFPVLLSHGFTSETVDTAKDQPARFAARAGRAWGRFKLAAVSSFAFVEATGPLYAAKLVRDALSLPSGGKTASPEPQLDPSVTLADKTAVAGRILRAMSLTDGFAPVVLLVGHGASVTNNPHASALHCGACGGYKGDVNARLLAALLNLPELRAGLAQDGIVIPDDTVFVGALHDTTTDAVTLYAKGGADLGQATAWLDAAGKIARTERALRLPRAQGQAQLAARSTDWAETRPEWALAGCNALIAAPRTRTRGKPLAGRAFLHDYDWTKDAGFGVLELILTAPVVVASWISLQYYGAVVAPQMFGAGNKLLHNVTGGLGVVEGNGGTLRGGLPWQSVHDGEKFIHEPLRLSVCVEAPPEAISDILSRHPEVKALFDNHWLHLFVLDEKGQMAQRYAGDLQWQDAA
jgi:uncharacterized protein